MGAPKLNDLEPESSHMSLEEEHEEAVHHDEGPWLISYADLMTLLMGFFALMTSMANFEENQFAQVGDETAKFFGGEVEQPFQKLGDKLKQVIKETSYDDFQRFLLYRNRENEIFHIFWKDGREHEKVHEVLNQARLGLKVIGGGYWVIAPSEGRVLIENSGLRQFQMNPDSSKTHKQVRAGLLNVFAQDSYWKSDFDLYQIGRSAAFPDSIRTLMTRDEFENP